MQELDAIKERSLIEELNHWRAEEHKLYAKRREVENEISELKRRQKAWCDEFKQLWPPRNLFKGRTLEDMQQDLNIKYSIAAAITLSGTIEGIEIELRRLAVKKYETSTGDQNFEPVFVNIHHFYKG